MCVYVGPWCAAELLSGVYGLIFPHGLLVRGHFLPGSMTYLYGTMLVSVLLDTQECVHTHTHSTRCHFPHKWDSSPPIQLLTVELPFLITINRRLSPLHHKRGILKTVGLALVVMATVCMNIRISWGLYMAYGWLTVAMAPALSWTCLLHLYISVTSFLFTNTRQS